MNLRVVGPLAAIVLAFVFSISNSALPDPNGNRETRDKKKPRWSRGLPASSDHFPIAVWLQDPRNAGRYKDLGINLYIGLWKGPTAEQLDELEKHAMPVMCSQNDYAKSQLERRVIVGWLQRDEPDNAQSRGKGKGYGPPVDPEKIVAKYRRLRAADSSRPILLNLGQGVAWDGYYGRGVRTNHPEDYVEYVKGCDITSFDIYPAVHKKPEVAGKLWYVARGVERLVEWSGEERPAWSCIETTHISNPRVKPSPAQVRAEVWMAITHGARGLIYFCHEFQPRFNESALLTDKEMANAVGEINRQIHELAPVIHSPDVEGRVRVKVKPARVSTEFEEKLGKRPIATMVKKHAGSLYIFAVRMEGSQAVSSFRITGLPKKAEAEVLGEDRKIEVKSGRFVDVFEPYAVHLYRIR